MNTLDSMRERHSVRAFTSQKVEKQVLTELLEAARYAPSGTNTQPWRMAVVQGEPLEKLRTAMVEAFRQGLPAAPDYSYYPETWQDPFQRRRIECGKQLYQALDIAKGDKAGKITAWENNYRFFDAPVAILFFLSSAMGQGSWLDMGMLMQNVMLGAVDLGLACCPQAAVADYPDITRQQLNIKGEDWLLVGGIALGYAATAKVNEFRTSREELAEICEWYG